MAARSLVAPGGKQQLSAPWALLSLPFPAHLEQTSETVADKVVNVGEAVGIERRLHVKVRKSYMF